MKGLSSSLIPLALAWIGLTAAQLSIQSNEVAPINMPQIQQLDVDCAKTGMTVTITFNRPFNGVIFSKGHFANPACRYIDGGNEATYTFVVPMTECGTTSYDTNNVLGFENTIIVQMDDVVQEIWDQARRIHCDWQSSFEKAVKFKPFTVGMLDVQEIRFSGDKIECWMDIKRGTTPFGSSVEGVLDIGEDITVVIYVSSDVSNVDLLVKTCYAYDGENIQDADVKKIGLIDDLGCKLKPKLMDYFYRTYETKDTGATIIAYSKMKAFKFPDKMGIYLTCDVELCKDRCTEFCAAPDYPAEPSGLVTEVVTPPVVFTTEFSCTHGSTDPRCTTHLLTTEFSCFPGSRDPRCTTPAPPTQFQCFPGSQDPRCTTPAPRTTQFQCFPGSLDPRCTTPAPRPTPFQCFPGSQDPRCTTPAPRPTPFQCFPGSQDPRCTTPSPRTTQFQCFPGSLDPRCTTPAPRPTPFQCFPGSQDPRCTTPAPRPTQFQCFPGSQDPRCTTPAPRPTPFQCFPGSQDPRCTTPAPRPTQFQCFPGSTDPRCTTTARPVTQFQCTPNSQDPRCTPPPTQFQCFPGSQDPRCTTPAPRTTPFQCFPGSQDPRCVRTTQFSCSPGSTDPRCIRTSTARFPVNIEQPGDFHGGKDPTYHAFHRWNYERAGAIPQVPRVKRSSEGEIKNVTISFTRRLVVLSVADVDGGEGNSANLVMKDISRKYCIPESHLIFTTTLLISLISAFIATTIILFYKLKKRSKIV